MTTTHDAAFYASLPRKYVGSGVLITDGSVEANSAWT